MTKGHTTIYIDPELVKIAKAMRINISKECEKHLWDIVGLSNNPVHDIEKFKIQKLAEIKKKEWESYQTKLSEMEKKRGIRKTKNEN